MAALRQRWRRNQRKLDPRRLVFIDETAVSTSMTRRRGRSARGQRLVCKVPFGAWQSVTMVAALRHDRMTAPMTLNGAMTGDAFRSYIGQVLGPTLRRGDIVVMDNVPLHRTQAVREALERLGVSVPTSPAYSPDLNPIEQAIAKLKAHLRKLAPVTLRPSDGTGQLPREERPRWSVVCVSMLSERHAHAAESANRRRRAQLRGLVAPGA